MAAIDFNNHFPARLRIMSDHLDHPDRHPDHKRGLARAVVRSTLQAARVALDVLLPPQCLACDALVSAPGTLCYACWDGAVFVSAPLCAACGTPFEFDHGPEALCGSCMHDRPRIDRARAVFVYNDVSRNLATGLKYRDRTHAAPALGGLACSGRPRTPWQRRPDCARAPASRTPLAAALQPVRIAGPGSREEQGA
jgi:hypothetical protein